MTLNPPPDPEVFARAFTDDFDALRRNTEEAGHELSEAVRKARERGPDIAEAISAILSNLGQTRADALAAVDRESRTLRAAVIAAFQAGSTEASIARVAKVNRLTVRRWLGK